MTKLLIGVVVAAFVVIVTFLSIDPNIQASSTQIANPGDTQHVYSITIEGEVEKPGTYSLQDSATMDDLINSAGGITSNGDQRCYFGSTLVNKGMTYYIAPIFDDQDVCATEQINKVNINADNVNTLMTISGFTSSIANSIVSHRESNGDFVTLESLQDVYGIGPATYKKIRNFVILHE